MEPKKVFISYAWEDQDFAEKILNFSNTLREHGIDATIDQYEENPEQGWPIWMENQIENSDFVLVVCTKIYLEKFKQVQTGKGVSWECGTIYQKLYELQGHNNKYIPIIFSNNDIQNIVPALKPFTFYNVEKNLQKLENRINGIPNTVKPPVKTPALPAKERKSMFISSPIDVELWNKAKWSGVGFVDVPAGGLLLGLIFKGDKNSALKIFENWQKLPNLDDYLTVTFIEGNIEKLPPNGYTCLLTPNMEETLKRAKEFSDDTDIILTFNRFQRMYPQDNFYAFNTFKNIVLKNKGIKLVMTPLTPNEKKSSRGFGYDLNLDKAVGISNIKYKDSAMIKKGDIESCVIPIFNKGFPLD